MGQVSGGKAPTRPNLFSCDKSFPEKIHKKVKVDHNRRSIRSNHTRWSYHLSKWWDWLEQPELWEALPQTVSMSEAITSSQHKNSLKDQYYLGSLLCSFPKHLVKYQLSHHQPSPPYLLYVVSQQRKNRCYPPSILRIDDPTLIRVNTKQLQIVENHFYIHLILNKIIQRWM